MLKMLGSLRSLPVLYSPSPRKLLSRSYWLAPAQGIPPAELFVPAQIWVASGGDGGYPHTIIGQAGERRRHERREGFPSLRQQRERGTERGYTTRREGWRDGQKDVEAWMEGWWVRECSKGWRTDGKTRGDPLEELLFLTHLWRHSFSFKTLCPEFNLTGTLATPATLLVGAACLRGWNQANDRNK